MSTLPLNSLVPEAPAEPPPLPRPDRVRSEHRFILRICAFAIGLSFLLVVLPDGQRVAFRFAPNHPLPEVCPVHALFHVDCPGCGLTRSFVSLAHGDWRASLAFHHVGLLLAIVTLAQIPYRLACLKWGRCPLVTPAMERWVPITLIALLVGNWVIKLFV